MKLTNEIDKAWTNIPGIHDNGPRDHGLWRLTLTAYWMQSLLKTEPNSMGRRHFPCQTSFPQASSPVLRTGKVADNFENDTAKRKIALESKTPYPYLMNFWGAQPPTWKRIWLSNIQLHLSMVVQSKCPSRNLRIKIVCILFGPQSYRPISGSVYWLSIGNDKKKTPPFPGFLGKYSRDWR